MKTALTLVFTIIFLAAETIMPAEAGWDPNKEEKELKRAAATIATFKKTDPGLKVFFDKAYGYTVFAGIAKGAIGIGGAHGKGLVFRKGTVIGAASLSQGTIGLQLGGQVYSQIIFFEGKSALERFTKGNFEFAAQASAVAATKGAAANAAYEKGVAVFTMAKGGLMYEASIGGQKFKFESKK